MSVVLECDLWLSVGSSPSRLHILSRNSCVPPPPLPSNSQDYSELTRALTREGPKRTNNSTCRYFNDEVEPIYQWIPELNKRVYSDKYERFIDKQYQVSEDVDFMLQAYKQLTGGLQSQRQQADREAGLTLENSIGSLAEGAPQIRPSSSSSIMHDEQAVIAGRKLLANRLNRLAKLGSDHSRQLLRSLRAMLAMDQEELSRFRALRLIRPTVEMDGRYTCSISSLDGDDLQSTRLIVYGKYSSGLLSEEFLWRGTFQ